MDEISLLHQNASTYCGSNANNEQQRVVICEGTVQQGIEEIYDHRVFGKMKGVFFFWNNKYR